MEKEENVYATTLGTEEMVKNQDGEGNSADKTASTVPEKFKDVDALARAYSALQAEFTRRSQRLKELERKMENLEDGTARSGAEKLRKNAQARKEETKRFEHFVAETEGRNAQAHIAVSTEEPIETNQPSIPLTEEKTAQNGGTVYELYSVLKETEPAEKRMKTGLSENAASEAQTGEELQKSVVMDRAETNSSETLYSQVCRDESVRLKIIGEYLASLGKSGAPLMRGGAGTLATPPKKAANISEAGNMALLYFKKPSVQ